MAGLSPMVVPPHFRSRSPLPLVALGFAVAVVTVVAYLQYQGRAQAERLAASTKQELAAAKAKLAELGKQNEQLQGEKEELEAARTELSKSVEAKEGELVELKATYQSFREKLKDEIAKGEINLEETGGRLRVGLVDKILFDPGEAEISKRGEEVLARVAEALAGIPDKQIQVSGHTDRMPINSKLAERYPTNWELSGARATNVVRFLAEKADVPPRRLVASGYGEYHPIASNKTPAGRARNRRIEILLTPMLAPRTVAKSKLAAGAENRREKTSQVSASKPGVPASSRRKSR